MSWVVTLNSSWRRGVVVLGFEPGEGSSVLSVEAEAAVLDRPGDGVVSARCALLVPRPKLAEQCRLLREGEGVEDSRAEGISHLDVPGGLLAQGKAQVEPATGVGEECLEVRTGHEQ